MGCSFFLGYKQALDQILRITATILTYLYLSLCLSQFSIFISSLLMEQNISLSVSYLCTDKFNQKQSNLIYYKISASTFIILGVLDYNSKKYQD